MIDIGFAQKTEAEQLILEIVEIDGIDGIDKLDELDKYREIILL